TPPGAAFRGFGRATEPPIAERLGSVRSNRRRAAYSAAAASIPASSRAKPTANQRSSGGINANIRNACFSIRLRATRYLLVLAGAGSVHAVCAAVTEKVDLPQAASARLWLSVAVQKSASLSRRVRNADF